MDKPEPKYQPYYNDEITLKELILKLQEYWAELWRKKLVLISFSILSGLMFLAWNIRKPISYTSAITFLVGEADEKKGAVIGTPFDQLHFEGIKNHKLLEIARSSKIVHQVLLSDDLIDNIIIANRIIDSYNLRERWKDVDWSDVDFKEAQNGIYSKGTRTAIDNLHQFLVGNKFNASVGSGLLTITYEGETELFSIIAKTHDEKLSSILINEYYSVLSDFYIDKTVGKPQRLFKQLKIREDSLRTVLNTAENALAIASDRTRGVISSVAKVNRNRVQRNLDLVSESYNETRTNRQRIEYILQTETPDFQIIDQTFAPIVVKPSMPKILVMGLIMGAIVSCFIILGRHIVIKALNSGSE